jgi:nucleotide-binding universal stress UspA family protein
VAVVDGSVPSRAALAWAVRQARLTGAVVEAVIAWEIPSTYGLTIPVGGFDFEGTAAQVAADAIAEVSSPDEPAKIRTKVVQGHPAQVLLDASAGAELLVIGSPGHGGFVEAMLGSVGQHCVHHATRCGSSSGRPVPGSTSRSLPATTHGKHNQLGGTAEG